MCVREREAVVAATNTCARARAVVGHNKHVTLAIGASSIRKHSFCTVAAISAAKPAVNGASCVTIKRPVFCTCFESSSTAQQESGVCQRECVEGYCNGYGTLCVRVASRTELTIVSLSHGITVRRAHTHTGERREGGGEEEVMMT